MLLSFEDNEDEVVHSILSMPETEIPENQYFVEVSEFQGFSVQGFEYCRY